MDKKKRTIEDLIKEVNFAEDPESEEEYKRKNAKEKLALQLKWGWLEFITGQEGYALNKLNEYDA